MLSAASWKEALTMLDLFTVCAACIAALLVLGYVGFCLFCDGVIG